MPSPPRVRPDLPAPDRDPLPAAAAPGRESDGVTRLAFNGQVLESWGCYPLGNGHRLYNPSLMRFHSPDSLSPFGSGGLNAYAYCAGDPVNATDPSGRSFEDIFASYLLPALTGALNFFLFRIAVSTIKTPGMSSASVKSSYFSAAGALVGMVGAAGKLLGSSESMYIAGAGTALSLMGATGRLRITRKAENKAWADQASKDAAAAAASRPGSPGPEPRSPHTPTAPPRGLTDPPGSTPPANTNFPPLAANVSRPGSLNSSRGSSPRPNSPRMGPPPEGRRGKPQMHVPSAVQRVREIAITDSTNL